VKIQQKYFLPMDNIVDFSTLGINITEERTNALSGRI